MPLRGYGPYVLFMWSVHSVDQSWDAVSGTGRHMCSGSPSLWMHRCWVKFHCSMSYVLIWKLALHSMPC